MHLLVIFVLTLAYFSDAGYIKLTSEERIATNNIESKYDFLMDLILNEIRYFLDSHNDTDIVIPPVSTGFEYDVLGIPFNGYFNTTKGLFTNPATIQRKGEVQMNHSSDLNKLVLSMTVTFDKMEVQFPSYVASVIGISESGSINVDIKNNAVYLEITLIFVPHCIVTVSNVNIIELSGITTNITGLGVFNPLEGEFISWILESYRTSFSEIIENIVQKKLEEELVKTKICKFKRTPFGSSEFKMYFVKN